MSLDSPPLSAEEIAVLRRFAEWHRRQGESLKIVLYEQHSAVYERLVERGVLAKALAERLEPKQGQWAFTYWVPPDSPFHRWRESRYLQ